MRRLIGIVAGIGLTLAVAAPAGAIHRPEPSATFLVRADPNDTETRPDLERIRSDLDAASVVVSIRAWHRVTGRHDMMILFDTRDDGAWDFVVDVFPGGRCVAYEILPGDISQVGSRSTDRVSRREVACRLPRGWFGIEKTVGFTVRNAQSGVKSTDRAPDVWRYRGL